MKTCEYCNKTKIPDNWFRCDECASTAIMDPSKKNMPVGGQTLWKNANGNYIPKPSN